MFDNLHGADIQLPIMSAPPLMGQTLQTEERREPMDFCDKIERMAKARGETIYSTERACEMANGTIGKWKGNRRPNSGNLAKLAKHFGVSMESLLVD